MLWKAALWLSFAVWLDLGHCYNNDEVFHEKLSLRPLRDGRLAAHFSFETILKNATPRRPETLQGDDVAQHYSLFPLPLGQILREYAVTELHLSLNAGKWDYKSWGYPEEPGVGAGAELWAWMGDGAPLSIDERWKGLRNSLAGLFCASLASMDEQRTISPKYAFRPEGSFPPNRQSYRLRHAYLPSESVCTENLTPFLKLLPCKASSGIAHLLNPHKLFDADWHGLGMHVHWDEEKGIVLRLTIQAVFDPVRTSSQRKREWSLHSVFDRDINKFCPAAAGSLIKVSLPTEGAYAIIPEPNLVQDGFGYYDIDKLTQNLDVAMRWPENSFEYRLNKPSTPLTDITMLRTMTGSTTSRGQLTMSITNHRDVDTQIIYLETLPWHVQFYLHTMKITVNGEPHNDALRKMSYVLPEAHGRPMLFESILILPPDSTLQLQLDVSKSFLRYTEHSPDAHRGWDLPPALLIPAQLIGNETSDVEKYDRGRSKMIYSPVLLVDLATPDFSMPYNVIIMSSTLIALVFGSIFNLLTREFVVLKV